MSRVTSKDEFQITPQKRGVDTLVVATPKNAKNVFELLTRDVEIPNSLFFECYDKDYGVPRDVLQEVYHISDRTLQYWSYSEDKKPKIQHHAITLLSLDAHPSLKVIPR